MPCSYIVLRSFLLLFLVQDLSSCRADDPLITPYDKVLEVNSRRLPKHEMEPHHET